MVEVSRPSDLRPPPADHTIPQKSHKCFNLHYLCRNPSCSKSSSKYRLYVQGLQGYLNPVGGSVPVGRMGRGEENPGTGSPRGWPRPTFILAGGDESAMNVGRDEARKGLRAPCTVAEGERISRAHPVNSQYRSRSWRGSSSRIRTGSARARRRLRGSRRRATRGRPRGRPWRWCRRDPAGT
jgi:hypothetical protein